MHAIFNAVMKSDCFGPAQCRGAEERRNGHMKAFARTQAKWRQAAIPDVSLDFDFGPQANGKNACCPTDAAAPMNLPHANRERPAAMLQSNKGLL
jgi:hypothetical protein